MITRKGKPLWREGFIKLSNGVRCWVYGCLQALLLKRCAKRERGKALYEQAHALLSHAGIDLLSLWEERSIEEAEARRRLLVLSLQLFWLTLSCWRRDDG